MIASLDARTRTDQNIADDKRPSSFRPPLDECKLDLIRAFPPLAGTMGVHRPSRRALAGPSLTAPQPSGPKRWPPGHSIPATRRSEHRPPSRVLHDEVVGATGLRGDRHPAHEGHHLICEL